MQINVRVLTGGSGGLSGDSPLFTPLTVVFYFGLVASDQIMAKLIIPAEQLVDFAHVDIALGPAPSPRHQLVPEPL